ncbi:MAG TPA: phospholipid carrier-dependent glycosyltransferase [Candidatus Limnocylindrales bacterium]
MTGRETGWPDPGTGAPTRAIGTQGTAGAIVAVLLAGLALRLILAQLLPGSGFGADLGLFRFWATNLADQGLNGFYARDFYHDYTPGYLYVLWLVGVVDKILPGGMGDLIKIPAIVADLALVYLVWSMVLELGGSRRAAIVAAALVAFNPVLWFDSVVWGQVDSVGVVFLLLGLRELWRDRPERAAILTVVAALVKPQLGILVPLVAFVTIRRALRPAGGFGDDDTPEPGRTTLRVERTVRGPVRILTTALAGLVTALLLSAPYGLSLPGLVNQVFSTAGAYPFLTVNADNPWALVTVNGNGVAENGVWVCDFPLTGTDPDGGPVCHSVFSVGPIPAVFVGTGLLLAITIATCIVVARRPDRRTMLVGLAILALAFFVVPTRVHERYLFPLFAIAAIPAAVSGGWRAAYLALSGATLVNMYAVLTRPFYRNPNISDWLGIGDASRSWPIVAIVALIHLVGLVWVITQLRDGALGRLGDAFAARRATPGRPRLPRPPEITPDVVPLVAAASAPPLPEPVAPPPRATEVDLPSWTERPSFQEAGLWTWFRSRLFDRPIRPDRTALLHAEPGGRLDRLDLWIVVVLVASVLSLRLWRLSEPFQMHFDEVYHARTAAEFLQVWRYGIDHDIYEWTHPHLAKYAIAGGIVAWGDDRVSATSALGVPVRDAAIEPRYDDPAAGGRAGERVWLATGSDVRGYDLADRGQVASFPVAGASAVTVDTVGHVLVIGADDGSIRTLDLAAIDLSLDAGTDLPEPLPLATAGEAIDRLHVTGDGTSLVAIGASGRVATFELATGTPMGDVLLEGAARIADAGTQPMVVATIGEVTDPVGAAGVVADLLGGDVEEIQARLEAAEDRVTIAALDTAEDRTAIEEAIADGRLAGFSIADQTQVAIADATGLTFFAPGAPNETFSLPLDGGAHGLALITGLDKTKLYVAAGTTDAPKVEVVALPPADDQEKEPSLERSIPMPGEVTDVGYDEPSQQIHVLGRTPAGDASTVYVIEPHGDAVYADARLPFRPAAWVMDVNGPYPSADRQQALAFADDGSVASVEVGKHAFAWRMPGVIAGAIMAGLLYLLARILFRRRSIAVGAGLLGLLDGMLFVQSRIAMNDVYVGVAIIAAYTLFAAIWTGAWRWRGAFWVAMPVIGVLLGFALASKWVAAYAIGALGILILARSALGRLVLVAGMIALTTVLGYIAINVPEGPNLAFMLIMIVLTVVATLVTVLHPIAWSMDEIRFAIAAPAAAGAAIFLGALAVGARDASVRLGSVAVTPTRAAFALVLVSIVVTVGFWLAGRIGFGPLAPPPGPDDPVRLLEPPSPPAPDWLRPGWALGLPVIWMVGCLLVVPVAVYVASYVPWAFIDSHRIVANWPPGHSGQTLIDLTGQMYAYHNNLSSPHAASSPWWAWPFDLKPVWFYQESLANGTAAAVYDAGNIAAWWLAVPALGFVAWQAFKRRSLGLALIAIAFACQWIPWARIDRAAFQYHYYTSLPFVLLALAYLLAELWHGASRRTWLLARLAAGAAIVAPAAMWLFHRPLCGFVRVDVASPGSRACPTVVPDFVLTPGTAILAVAVGIAAIVVVRQLTRLEPVGGDDGGRRPGIAGLLPGGMGPLVLTGVVAVGALVAVSRIPDNGQGFVHWTNIPVEPIALLLAVPLLAMAAFVATARDARRFVVGTFVAIAGTFLIWYPNLSALPLPAALVNAYQGFIPTYLYPFQFPVNTTPPSERAGAAASLITPGSIALLLALTAACIVFAYSASVWRVTLAERRATRGGDPSGGLASSGGP